MYVAVRRYEGVDQGTVDEVMRRVNEGFVPIISQVAGFVAYYALDAGGGVVASISVFQDRTGAEESSRRAADWVRQNLASLLPNAPQVTVGEAPVHRTG
jgi:hypothetical protein